MDAAPRPANFPGDGRPLGTMLAVASGKGGVGKTLLSVSLAHAFAARGERVLLFDGDLGMANVDVQLGISPASDIGAVIAGRVALKDAVTPVRRGTGAGPNGQRRDVRFDVIAGRSGSGALAGLSAERASGLAAGLSAISLSYDRVVMDLGAGAGPALLRLASAADEVLVVLTDEPTSLTDAYAFVKMLRLRDECAVPLAAVNMAAGETNARRAFDSFAKTCAHFLSFEPDYAGPVRRDPAAPAAVRRQQSLLEHAPGCPAAQDIARMAEQLSAQPALRAA